MALANEGGGRLVLGVSPKIPRRVVGSAALRDLQGTVHTLLQRIGLRVEADEVAHPDGRVVVLRVPSRPVGTPIAVDGSYWMRAGESLTGMTPDMLRRIFDEGAPDFSASICPAAVDDDLDPAAVDRFRALWSRKSGNVALRQVPSEQLLEDAGLLDNGRITFAALILIGTAKALRRHLPQAEIVFEYRSTEEPGAANQRVELRQGFLTVFDELWRLVNLRNDLQHFRDGLFVRDVPTFNEAASREAILNAVCHRDYRHGGSVWIRQFPRRLEIESPGGFPEGVTTENILYRQHPRNRRLAEALARCGFVERAGQGADLMFRECVREGKALPDYHRSDASAVSLTLHGQVRDPRFIRFLERIAEETGESFSVPDLVALAYVHDGEPVPDHLARAVKRLLASAVIEQVSRGKLVLSRRFYRFLRRPGEYTRKRGLDHETNKELLLAHVVSAGAEGTRMEELQQVLPSKTRAQVKHMIRELRDEGRVHLVGQRRAARWFAGAAPAGGLDTTNPPGAKPKPKP